MDDNNKNALEEFMTRYVHPKEHEAWQAGIRRRLEGKLEEAASGGDAPDDIHELATDLIEKIMRLGAAHARLLGGLGIIGAAIKKATEAGDLQGFPNALLQTLIEGALADVELLAEVSIDPEMALTRPHPSVTNPAPVTASELQDLERYPSRLLVAELERRDAVLRARGVISEASGRPSGMLEDLERALDTAQRSAAIHEETMAAVYGSIARMRDTVRAAIAALPADIQDEIARHDPKARAQDPMQRHLAGCRATHYECNDCRALINQYHIDALVKGASPETLRRIGLGPGGSHGR